MFSVHNKQSRERSSSKSKKKKERFFHSVEVFQIAQSLSRYGLLEDQKLLRVRLVQPVRVGPGPLRPGPQAQGGGQVTEARKRHQTRQMVSDFFWKYITKTLHRAPSPPQKSLRVCTHFRTFLGLVLTGETLPDLWEPSLMWSGPVVGPETGDPGPWKPSKWRHECSVATALCTVQQWLLYTYCPTLLLLTASKANSANNLECSNGTVGAKADLIHGPGPPHDLPGLPGGSQGRAWLPCRA